MPRLPLEQILKNIPGTIFLDVDGTLLPDGTRDLPQESVMFINTLKDKCQIVIASNSIKKDRTENLARAYNLPHLVNEKPTVAACTEALQYKNPYVVVGDKWWVDGIYARKIGAKFFRIRPIRASTDAPVMTLQYIFNSLTFWFLPIISFFIKKVS